MDEDDDPAVRCLDELFRFKGEVIEGVGEFTQRVAKRARPPKNPRGVDDGRRLPQFEVGGEVGRVDSPVREKVS